MATVTAALPKVKGGSFLIESAAPDHIMTPEDFTEEQRQMAATAGEFMRNEMTSRIEELERQAPGVAIELLRKAGELGLLGVVAPEKFGGLERTRSPGCWWPKHMSGYASFSGGAHGGIGTLPIVFFGRRKDGEWFELSAQDLAALWRRKFM